MFSQRVNLQKNARYDSTKQSIQSFKCFGSQGASLKQQPIWVIAFAIFYSSIQLVSTAEAAFNIRVVDHLNQPIKGIKLINPNLLVDPKASDQNGYAELKFDKSLEPEMEIPIHLSKENQDLEILSPSDSTLLVPGDESGQSDDSFKVVVAKRGDLTLLNDRTTVRSFIEQINQVDLLNRLTGDMVGGSPTIGLESISHKYGYTTDQLSSAVDSWIQSGRTTYDLGLAKLYLHEQEKAVTFLSQAFNEQLLNRKSTNREKADIAFFLGGAMWVDEDYGIEGMRALLRGADFRHNNLDLMRLLALLLQAKKEYKDADEGLEEILQVEQTTGEKGTLSEADTLMMLGVINYDKKDYEKSESYFRKAIAIRELLLPEYHWAVGQALTALALVMHENHKYGEIESVLKRTLAIHEAIYSENHAVTAMTLSHMGLNYVFEKKYQDAEPIFRRVVAIRRAVLNDTEVYATSLREMGMCLSKQEKFEEAKTYYEESLEVYKKNLGSNHLKVAEVNLSLGNIYLRSGQAPKAEIYFKEALAIEGGNYGENSPKLVEVLRQYVSLLDHLGRRADATKVEERIKTIELSVDAVDYSNSI